MNQRKTISKQGESDVIQSSRRKRVSRIDPLSGYSDQHPVHFKTADIVKVRWSDDDLAHLADGTPRHTGIVLTVSHMTQPENVEIMWDSGEIDWDYADDLQHVEESPRHE
jgi:hypothetical protein